MSHYVTTPMLEIKGLEELSAALRHQGFEVEVHAEAVTLYDWHGWPRPERAHVVIRRQHTGSASSNDVGFLRGADGRVQAIISDYDSAKFGAAWQRALVKECGVQRAILRAARMGHRAVRTTDAKGRPRLEIVGRF